MNKTVKSLLVVCLSVLCLFLNHNSVQAQSLEEVREDVIEFYMQGTSKTFTYEEVEAFVANEERWILENGTVRSLNSYSMEGGDHSTSHAINLADYLGKYLEANMGETGEEDLYPFAVDFKSLPSELVFEGDGDEKYHKVYTVSNEDGRLSIEEYGAWKNTHAEYLYVHSGFTNETGTKELQVKGSDGSLRTVGVNTQMIVQETSPHRNDHIFSFFYNESGTLSLLHWNAEDPQETLVEYATVETKDELQGGGADNVSEPVASTSNWSLPHDWRMLSPRRQDVPPVTWVLTSIGDGETIAIEPFYAGEGIVSGFINPNYSVEVITTEGFDSKVSPVHSARPDESGYFSLDVGVGISKVVTIEVLNEAGHVVFDSVMNTNQFRPTALAHDSGYLTLERYFVNQDYVEGQTYPYAEVSVALLNGYAGMGTTTTADSNGYFYLSIGSHKDNRTTNVVTVTHPDTGEKISVAPYPWTQDELDNAAW